MVFTTKHSYVLYLKKYLIFIAVIPKSTNKERIIDNLKLFDFELDEKDFARIEALEKGLHFCWDPTDVS